MSQEQARGARRGVQARVDGVISAGQGRGLPRGPGRVDARRARRGPAPAVDGARGRRYRRCARRSSRRVESSHKVIAQAGGCRVVGSVVPFEERSTTGSSAVPSAWVLARAQAPSFAKVPTTTVDDASGGPERGVQGQTISLEAEVRAPRARGLAAASPSRTERKPADGRGFLARVRRQASSAGRDGADDQRRGADSMPGKRAAGAIQSRSIFICVSEINAQITGPTATKL